MSMIQPLTKKQQEVLDFLKEYYEKNGFSPSLREVATHFGVTVSTVQGYFMELSLKGVISKLPNKSRSIIIKGDNLPRNMSVTVPELGTISAGEGIIVHESEEPNLVVIPASWVNKASGAQYYCLRVSGFSMWQDGILDNDLILVRRQATADNGDTVVAIRKDSQDERATLKVYYDKGDTIELRPKNDLLKPIILNREDVEIRGKFCGLIREENC